MGAPRKALVSDSISAARLPACGTQTRSVKSLKLGDVVVGSGRPCPDRVGGQRAGHQDGPVVQPTGCGVDASNERALAATDQTHTKFAIERCIDWHGKKPRGVRPRSCLE